RAYVRQSATLQEGLDCYTDRSAGPTGRRFQPPLASVRSTGTGLRKRSSTGQRASTAAANSEYRERLSGPSRLTTPPSRTTWRNGLNARAVVYIVTFTLGGRLPCQSRSEWERSAYSWASGSCCPRAPLYWPWCRSCSA